MACSGDRWIVPPEAVLIGMKIGKESAAGGLESNAAGTFERSSFFFAV